MDESVRKDRLIDFYYGRGGASPASQHLTRQRVHWICSKVRGKDVLDVGCSGGLVAILLGREGLNVTGVDNFIEAVEEATKELAAEEPIVQERVKFSWAQGAELPFPDAAFDTVILGEVIEHIVLPERVLTEARRVMRPGGTLILTTPYGRDETPDHKSPVYLGDLDTTISKLFQVESVELLQHWIGLIARVGGQRAPDADRQMLLTAEARIRSMEIESREREQRLRASIDGLNVRSANWGDTIKYLREQLNEERSRTVHARAQYNALRSKGVVRLLLKAKSLRRKLLRR